MDDLLDICLSFIQECQNAYQAIIASLKYVQFSSKTQKGSQGLLNRDNVFIP